MNYVALTYDGEQIQFAPEHLAVFEKNMANKTPFKFKGQMLQGADIRRLQKVGESRDVNQGSTLKLTAEELFQLPSGVDSKGFWFQVVQQNQKRRADNKPWVFNKAILFARDESGISEPEALFEFIEAEWESVAPHNIPNPPVDHVAKKQVREYLATEEGRAYAISKGERLS